MRELFLWYGIQGIDLHLGVRLETPPQRAEDPHGDGPKGRPWQRRRAEEETKAANQRRMETMPLLQWREEMQKAEPQDGKERRTCAEGGAAASCPSSSSSAFTGGIAGMPTAEPWMILQMTLLESRRGGERPTPLHPSKRRNTEIDPAGDSRGKQDDDDPEKNPAETPHGERNQKSNQKADWQPFPIPSALLSFILSSGVFPLWRSSPYWHWRMGAAHGIPTAPMEPEARPEEPEEEDDDGQWRRGGALRIWLDVAPRASRASSGDGGEEDRAVSWDHEARTTDPKKKKKREQTTRWAHLIRVLPPRSWVVKWRPSPFYRTTIENGTWPSRQRCLPPKRRRRRILLFTTTTTISHPSAPHFFSSLPLPPSFRVPCVSSIAFPLQGASRHRRRGEGWCAIRGEGEKKIPLGCRKPQTTPQKEKKKERWSRRWRRRAIQRVVGSRDRWSGRNK